VSEDTFIHLVSFDIPYPPDYGGIIDVFYKIKYLHQAGFKIILHCFQYNNKPQAKELEKYCYKIYYYQRNTSFSKQLSFLPFTVYSRANKELLNNLNQDNYPVLFETLHSAYYISHPSLSHKKKILRLSNIEHHYYFHLFLAEKNIFKKIYFLIETIKLYFYEKKAFASADVILPVTENDDAYVHRYYYNYKTSLIPSFHNCSDIYLCKGKGDYLLYHGNLSVAENYKSAEWLIKNIAPHIDFQIIIAGKNPPKFLYKLAKKFSHIQIVANPDNEEMKQLIQNAHIVWLYTHQATGLKLKLLNSLFSARFIICNDKMIAGTSLQANLSLYIKNTAREMIETINHLKTLEFDDGILFQRKQLLEKFDNNINLEKLKAIIANS